MKTAKREFVLFLISILILFACLFYSPIRGRFCVVLWLVVFFVLRKLFLRNHVDSNAEVAPGVTRRELDEATRTVKDAAKTIDGYAHEIKKREVVVLVRDIGKVIREIARNLQDDPSDIRMSKTFLQRRLPEAIEIIAAYARLSKRSLDDKGVARLVETEEAISRIKRGFHDHLQRCLEDDLSKLRVDNRMTEYFYPDADEGIQSNQDDSDAD